MKINFFVWKDISAEQKEKILKRAQIDISEIVETAKLIIADVKTRGDVALLEYIEKFDGVKMKPENLKIKKEEFEQAESELSEEFKKAVRKNIDNIQKFHSMQVPPPMEFLSISPGVYAGEKSEAIDSVGIYVPRGKGSFPSVLYMLAVPAVIAGVENILIATPPGPDGNIDAGTLYTAQQCSVTDVYKISGIQGIGALAYGTETVPGVDKIIGPGSSYVTAAKRVLYGTVDVGVPAGPSESVILADKSADPRKTALDFLIEAEHGPDSAAVLVTDSMELGKEVIRLVPSLVEKLPDLRRKFIIENMKKYSAVVIVDNLTEGVNFVNQYAPEHLSVVTENPLELLSLIKNAGEILLGPDTPFTLANFSMGPNAVLPTGGFAKTFSPVSVRDFCKYSSVGYVTPQGYEDLKESAALVAEYEGFPAHAMALTDRVK